MSQNRPYFLQLRQKVRRNQTGQVGTGRRPVTPESCGHCQDNGQRQMPAGRRRARRFRSRSTNRAAQPEHANPRFRLRWLPAFSRRNRTTKTGADYYRSLRCRRGAATTGAGNRGQGDFSARRDVRPSCQDRPQIRYSGPVLHFAGRGRASHS